MTASLTVLGEAPGQEEILTKEACAFIAALNANFDAERLELLQARQRYQARLDEGFEPIFLSETKHIRDDLTWRVAPYPAELADRRVEITGSADRKMLINALNSGANCFMCCLEDATSPHWSNVIDSQINLRDAVRGTISFTDPTTKKHYALGEKRAVLLVRPRGWHMPANFVRLDGKPTSASLIDFGLYFFHNARELAERGTAPYFYLPKIEHYQEAELWAKVFAFSEDYLRVPKGSIRATTLIETLPAAFQAEEILYALRDYSTGLNCGRWDYIFSYIKCFRSHKAKILPDRTQVSMVVPFMRAYCLHVIRVCHKRGAHAIGGMAAQIPIRDDEQANQEALGKVRADKRREAHDGHDGTWVAHPGLVALAKEEFDKVMTAPNQIDKKIPDSEAAAAEQLTAVCAGTVTRHGIDTNIDVGVHYIAAWLRGLGVVPLYNLMEDAATAEISRTQLWQWRRFGAKTDAGEVVDDAMLKGAFQQCRARLTQEHGEDGFESLRFSDAFDFMESLVFADELADFLTVPAYERYLSADLKLP